MPAAFTRWLKVATLGKPVRQREMKLQITAGLPLYGRVNSKQQVTLLTSDDQMTNPIAIRVGAIENSGPNTLVSYLRNAGSAATKIDIAVAFITTAGLESVLHLLKRTSAQGQVRLLTGLYQGFTEPKALRTLLREQQQSDGRFLVQISTDQHFHWKTYFLLGKSTANIVIGSSNLTDDGLRQTGEFNAVLSMRKASKPFRDLHGVFEKHWQSKSKLLAEEVLVNYEKWRTSIESTGRNRNVPLGKILAVTRRKPKEEPTREPRFWRMGIDGELSEEAQSLLRETTNWDRRGYFFLNTWRTSLGIGDQVVLFDRIAGNVTVVEIKDTAITPARTPDGSHFAAYLPIRGIGLRKLVPKRWKSLKGAGLIRLKGDVDTTQRLSATKFEAFVSNLKEAAK